jgi:tetratricopeptide (TPR) repeat protein
MFEMFSERRRHLREARRLKRMGDFQRSGELFELGESHEEALEMYQKAHNHLASARLYEKMGRLKDAAVQYEQAGSYETAATIFSRLGDHGRSAQTFQRAGLHFKAGLIHQQTRNWREAALCFEKAGQEARAAECFAAAGALPQAARIYKTLMERLEDAGEAVAEPKDRALALQAAECLEKAKEYPAAAEAYRFAREWRRAAELFVRLQRPREAADMFFHAQEYDKAMMLVYNHGLAAFDVAELAMAMQQAGRYSEAATLYETVEQWGLAADAAMQAGQVARAGAMFEKAEDWPNAAHAYVEAGLHEQAAEAFVKAKLNRAAAEFFFKCGKKSRAAELYSGLGDHYESGQILLGLGRDEEALADMQKVPYEDERYLEASDQIGQIFLRKGLLAMAVDRYRMALAGRGLNDATRSLYFNLASALERAGKESSALMIYQRIAMTDFNFRGVGARVEQLRQRAASPTSGGALEEGRSRVLLPRQAEPREVLGGRYQILERIADGGMGTVYKARDLELDEVIALKLLRRTDPTTVERLKRELKLTRKLMHPNIVRLFHFSEADNMYFLCMEFVEGKTLKSAITERGALPMAEAVPIIQQIGLALDAAHKAGVIHRDIKPQNVLLDTQNVVKVLDFGIAWAVDETLSLTLDGEVVGTPEYMSPEQISAKPVDARSDLYSLGVVAYELVTGQVPFRGETPVATVLQHLRQMPVPPSQLQPLVPKSLEAIVLRLLQKEPSDRYGSAPELLADLAQLEV